MKFEGSAKDVDFVFHCATPMEAAKAGRRRTRPLRSDWERVKDEIMYEVVMAKFTQHKDLTAILLGSGEATLVEHTKNDSYWGDGGDGSGKNMLGKTLMEVRAEIRAKAGDGAKGSAKEAIEVEDSPPRPVKEKQFKTVL